MDKKLVCYFSASGVTKAVAQKIGEVIQGDLFEIEPKEKYTEADLDWMDKTSRSSLEMQDKNSRPEIKSKVNNISEYNEVILGFPVWWYTAPTIINTFIEENDLTNKKVYIFVTSGGSSFGGSLKDLREKYSNINFVSGIRFTSNVSSDDILTWLK